MLSRSYSDYIYQIIGEEIRSNPQKVFHSEGVYLVIDKELKLIWIWAGIKSRLFHRYIAANWAGKLKSKKKYLNYKYELIKEGREPRKFLYIIDEIEEKNLNLEYPGQSRNSPTISALKIKGVRTKKSQEHPEQSRMNFMESDRAKINNILLELKEIHMDIKHSFKHMEKKISEIEKMISN